MASKRLCLSCMPGIQALWVRPWNEQNKTRLLRTEVAQADMLRCDEPTRILGYSITESEHDGGRRCGTQALLLVGIRRAKRKPTKLHPYGV